jgi:hypothetical protein
MRRQKVMLNKEVISCVSILFYKLNPRVLRKTPQLVGKG